MRLKRGNRGLVVVGVLVVVVLSSLIAGAIVARSDGHQDLAMASLSTMQTRSLAWSGVLGVVSELQTQRDDILTGEAPTLTSQWTVPTASGDGVVRLIPWPAETGEQEHPWLSESSKLDVNHATAAMMAKLPGVSTALAARIVSQRRQGYECPEALGALGLSVKDLFGASPSEGGSESESGATPTPTGEAAALEQASEAPGSESAQSLGLLDVLTTFAFDPNVQAGVGEGNERWAGTARINLGLPWSDALEAAMRERFGEEVTRQAAEIFKAREPLTKDSQFVGILIAQGVPTEAWGSMLDIFTTSNDLYRLGRVDLLTARPEVLAAIPGIDASAAAKIVQMRGGLSKEDRQSMAWPVTEGVLTPQQFSQAVDWIATRPMQFRVRVEAGIAPRGEDGEAQTDAPLLRPMVLEAVIDLAGPRARVAYLRDITHLSIVQERAREQEKVAVLAAENEAPAPPPSRPPAAAPAAAPPRAARGGGGEKIRTEGDKKASSAKDSDAEPSAQDEATPQPQVDRRIGRWTNRSRR